MNHSKKQVVMLFVLVLFGSTLTLSAQSENARDNRIVGVWDVEVTVRNCATGVPVAAFRGLHKFELGGTAQVVPSTNPAALSSHMGVWKSIGKNTYRLVFKMFRFDAAGNNIGWVVVRNDVVINEDATQYAGSGEAEFFNANGDLVGRSCPEFEGPRLQ